MPWARTDVGEQRVKFVPRVWDIAADRISLATPVRVGGQRYRDSGAQPAAGA
jgi:hypothetical protein